MPSGFGYLTLWYKQKAKCYFCKKYLRKKDFRTKILIHHINHNHKDNILTNRCLVHSSCHQKHHIKDRMPKMIKTIMEKKKLLLLQELHQ